MFTNLRRLSLLIALCGLLFASLPAQANDDIKVKGPCDLYDAIEAANKDSRHSGCDSGVGPHDTIIVPIDTRLSRILPDIDSNITIEGYGSKLTFKKRKEPAFIVEGATLTLKNLRIRFQHKNDEDVLEIRDGKLILINTLIQNCSGVVNATNSRLELHGQSSICGHSSKTVMEWFVPPPPPRPPETCAMLPGATVTALYGLGSGVQCQHVSPQGIGNQYVLSRGFIDAIDLWGYVEQGIEVCFPRLGAALFLDSATRTPSSLESYSSGHRTCASANRPGTIVLVYGQPTTVAQEPVISQPATTPAVSQPVVQQPAVDGCPARTTGHINFRTQPSLDADKIGVVLRGSTVGVVRRTAYWYFVNYKGRRGWIGGKYVDNIGNC